MCAGAAAAAASAAVKRRHFSCEVHRCDDDDNDNDDDDGDNDVGAAAAQTDDKLRRTSSPSPALVHRCRRHNSLVLVEVVYDCRCTRPQQATKTAPSRPRSESESPRRSLTTGPVTYRSQDSPALQDLAVTRQVQ